MNAKDPAVSAILAALDHPLKKDIAAARLTLLGAAAGVSESVKWNAPSFAAAGDFFATINLRADAEVQVIFHTGAKGAGTAFRANRPVLAALARAWISAL